MKIKSSDLINAMNSLGDDEHTKYTLVDWFNINLKKRNKKENKMFTMNDIRQFILRGSCEMHYNIKIEYLEKRFGVRVYKLIDNRTEKQKLDK